MKYNTIKYNDVANAPGISVSIYLQGCPHRCYNCFNPETWDFDGGQEFQPDLIGQIIQGLRVHNIDRNLCILGGEPLCPENLFLTQLIVTEVKKALPNTKIYIWTGYLYEDLQQSIYPAMKNILEQIDCIIDGPYVEELRDITLPMRGSSNQRIIYLKN